MKLKIVLSFILMVMAISPAFASFPVQRTASVATTITNSAENDSKSELFSPAAAGTKKSQGIALVLLLTLGLLAGHRWYLGSPWFFNVFFILTLGGLGIWALVDLIRIIAGTYTPVNGRYKKSFF